MYYNQRDKNGRFVKKSTTSSKSKQKKTVKNKVTHTVDVIILDASASMRKYTDETITGFNKYLETIAQSEKSKITAFVNVLQFHQRNYTTWTFRNVEASKVPTLTRSNYVADGGCTALNDAIINGTEGLLIAKKNNSDWQFTVTIFTDGQDNDSITSVNIVRQRVQELNDAGITVVFVGAGSDYMVKQSSANMGIFASNTLSYNDDKAGRVAATNMMSVSRSAQTVNYSKGITTNVGFFVKE